MKKIVLLLITILLLIQPSVTFAETGSYIFNLREVVENDYFDIVDTLIIDEEDEKYLENLDYSKFNVLTTINIKNLYNIDLSKISPKNKVYLSITNSVLDFSKLDQTKFSYIAIYYTYDIANNLNYSGKNKPENSEYEIDSKYDEELNKIAREIYSKSQNQNDIIRNVTDYVTDLITYGYADENLSLAESALKYKTGVCAHYSYITSQLLNKLEIFTINTGGVAGEEHAWVIIYKDGKWYGHDPTWLDVPNHENDSEYYMSDLSNKQSIFNTTHIMEFTLYDKIPINKRVSKMSILNNSISFNANGGNSVSKVSVKYYSTNNNKVKVSDKQNYDFLGWFTEAAGGIQIYDENGNYNKAATEYWNSEGKWIYTKNITLYAHWKEKPKETPATEVKPINESEQKQSKTPKSTTVPTPNPTPLPETTQKLKPTPKSVPAVTSDQETTNTEENIVTNNKQIGLVEYLFSTPLNIAAVISVLLFFGFGIFNMIDVLINKDKNRNQ